jgi:Zn finger protein HypA/HybF involved in hydrogenase expression
MDALSPWVAFERHLEEDSPLLERKKEERIIRPGTVCHAGTPRDRAPFQARQKVAYCPSCRTPYHLECWLQLDQCPVCQHKVRELIDRVFLSLAGSKG